MFEKNQNKADIWQWIYKCTYQKIKTLGALKCLYKESTIKKFMIEVFEHNLNMMIFLNERELFLSLFFYIQLNGFT